MSPGPYMAVCGECNLALRLHPFDGCSKDYLPIEMMGSVVGFHIIRKKENGEAKKEEAAAKAA